MHEGGFDCRKTASGEVIFTSPANERLPAFTELPGIESGEDPVALLSRVADTAHTDEHTCGTQWHAGETIDWGLAVSHLV